MAASKRNDLTSPMNKFALGILASYLVGSCECIAAQSFYGGIAYSEASTNARANQIAPGATCTNCDLQRDFNPAGVFVGVNWTRYLGAELGYEDFGEVLSFTGTVDGTAARATQDNYGIYIAQKLVWPVSDSVDIYGKFGAIFWNGEIKYRVGEQQPLANADSNVEFTHGLGLAFNFVSGAHVSLEWSQYNKLGDSSIALVRDDKVETLDVDIRQVSLRLWYEFGR